MQTELCMRNAVQEHTCRHHTSSTTQSAKSVGNWQHGKNTPYYYFQVLPIKSYILVQYSDNAWQAVPVVATSSVLASTRNVCTWCVGKSRESRESAHSITQDEREWQQQYDPCAPGCKHVSFDM